MKKSLKITFLYIGTAIGAGFSSGKEIALFFGDASPLNVAVSSVFMALLCGLFLIAGKQNLMPKNKIMRLCVFFSAGISLCSMCAGGEFVMRSMTGVPMLGLAMAILGAIIVILGIEKIKIVNSIVVPLIVLCVALIFFKLDPQNYSLPFSIAKPIMYSGLDVLLGGVIISDEGKEMSYKEISLTCIFISVFIFALLYMLQTVVLADGLSSSMPVLAVSEKFGLKAICGVLIAGAIFTTLVSALKITSDSILLTVANIRKPVEFDGKKYKPFVVFGCLLVAYPISFAGFDNIVDTMYPFISMCGIVLTAIVSLRLALKCLRRIVGCCVRARNDRKLNGSSRDESNRNPRHRDDENTSTPLPSNDALYDDRRSRLRNHTRHRNSRSRSRRRTPLHNRSLPRNRRYSLPSKALQTATCDRPPRPSL